MTFVYPSFLWAFLAIAIPVIIHLFNYRKYQKVYFTNVRFLKELQQESKSKSRLKEILVLIARCLAIACLVLAFSQPILFDKGDLQIKKGPKAISIYLDNSFSMDNVGEQGPLIDFAKGKAKEIVAAYGNEDKVQVITNDFEGKHQRFYNKEEAINVIDEIKVSSAVRLLDQVVKRQSDFLKNSGFENRKIYTVSDAQKSTFDLQGLKPDTTVQMLLVPLAANLVNNVYVDTVWFETPMQQKGFIQKLHAKIVNNGKADVEAGSAKLYLNKKQIALSSFSLKPGSAQEVLFTFECKESGFNYGSVKIEDYPVTFDDELFFAFNSKMNIGVYLIQGKEQSSANAFESLFKNDSIFKFTSSSEQNISYSEFKNNDVIILNQLSDLSSGLISELTKFSLQGGAIVIIPAEEIKTESYQTALIAFGLPVLGAKDTVSQKVDKVEMTSDFYSGVFEKPEDRLNLPLVNQHYALIKNSKTDFEALLSLQNNAAFLGRGRFNNSSTYLFSAPFALPISNFVKHALFVPSFYQICFKSLKATPLFYPVSSNVYIQIKNEGNVQEQPPHIKQLVGPIDVIPSSRIINNRLNIYTQNQIQVPGFYELLFNRNSLLPLAFNFSRNESDLECYSREELQKIIEDGQFNNIQLIEDDKSNLTEQIKRGSMGQPLWKLFIILALGCIALELTLLRILK